MSVSPFDSYQLGPWSLKNRIVMAPMTRSRAIGGVPNELMAKYYAQRASAGLIVTEATSSSPNGMGYARIPGIYSDEQVTGWKLVTDAVHEKGGTIVLQVFHTGRVSHPLNMPKGARVLAPSEIVSPTEMWTDEQQMQPQPVPEAMSLDDIRTAVNEYRTAAKNAVAAGFDGLEIHSANGYLINQFINTQSNHRTDEYGGSIENRSRFLLEVVDAVTSEIGANKTGVRISPHGVFNTMDQYDGLTEDYEYIVERLSDKGIAYLHHIRAKFMGAPQVPSDVDARMKAKFNGTFIINGGYERESMIAALENGDTDLVAIGKPFISNPDLVERYKNNSSIAPFHTNSFYTPGEEGYTDYPHLQEMPN
ncbi:alkene reductase [Flagellimonas meridianipacifica]|uniref:N-ethylmaleimide reductase n=1 Tax=Flagellimonas meridianipacifica TaxID=1080225 RepID=A0A2T0MH02_9FLAO|nr:alkene reductase [Allomuricauda pacifica]PRX56858.1 N-ethylmaleimide reductase [Allomuricauda pacifica]